MLLTLAAGWIVLASLVLAWAVASDARARGVSPWLWFLAALLFNVFGALAYLVLRPAYRLDEEVVESEPAEEAAVPLPSITAAAAGHWERAPERPNGPAARTAVVDDEPEFESVEERPGATAVANRTWLYVGAVVFLGLVVAAALLALLTAPASPQSDAAKRPAPTPVVVTPAPTQPPAALLAPTAPPTPQPTATATPAASATVYTVQAGDTLGGIAARYGVTVKQIQDANGLQGETIFEGQRLKIPERSP